MIPKYAIPNQGFTSNVTSFMMKGMLIKKVRILPNKTVSMGRPCFCFRMKSVVAANPNPAINAAIFPQKLVKEETISKDS